MNKHPVSVPNHDHTGNLSPLIDEALKHGATAALDPADVHNTLVVFFKTEAQAKAFKASVAKVLKGADAAEPEAPAPDA